MKVDLIQISDSVLSVVCSGPFGIGSEGNSSGELIKGAIEQWVEAHPADQIEQVDLDFRKVEYSWGDGPVSSLVYLFRKGIKQVRFFASEQNQDSLESLVVSSGLPGFVVKGRET